MRRQSRSTGSLPSRSRPDEHEDFVDVLLQVQTDSNQDIRLTDDQIKAVLTDILIAGTDTSSATLVWIMLELIKNPSVKSKAQEEVRGVVKESMTVVHESDLPKLEYLRMIVKEALRLHPPAPLLVPRETTEKCTIKGYEIPAKTREIQKSSNPRDSRIVPLISEASTLSYYHLGQVGGVVQVPILFC